MSRAEPSGRLPSAVVTAAVTDPWGPRRRRRFAVVLLAGAMVLPRAAASAEEPSVAECLAASGASIRLDNEHRLRAERTELLRCASASCPGEIRTECIRRVDEVTSAIPTVILGAEDGNGNDLTAVKVTMDGELLADHLQGIALAVDPGAHTFVFEAAGQPSLRRTWVIRQGQKNRMEVVAWPGNGVSVHGRDARRMAGESALRVGAQEAGPARDVSASLGSHKKWAIGAAAFGVVGLGLGAAFGWQARLDRNDARAICPADCPSQVGVDRWHDARTAGNVATAAFVAGGAGLAAAAVLWFTAPSSPPAEGDSPSTAELLGGRGHDLAVRAHVPVPGGDGRFSLALGGRW